MAFGRQIARNIAALALIVPVFLAISLLSVTTAPTGQAEALDNEEAAFLGIINDYRAQNGLGPLTIDSSLNSVARWMADDLAANDYFSHTDSLGRDPFTRMDQQGYAVNTYRGENLVAGTMEASESFRMWRDSEGHRANMLGSNYTVIGIARAYNASSTFGWYWATEFGGDPVGAPPPQQAPAPPAPAPVVENVAPAPQPQAAAPAPEQPAAPPEAPTIVPTAVPTPIHAADGNAPWWHAVKFVSEKEVSDGFWMDGLIRGTQMFSVAALTAGR